MANNMLQSLLFSGGGSSSGSGVLVVHQNAETGALDKTWQQIHDADFAVIHYVRDGVSAVAFASGSGEYGSSYVIAAMGGDDLTFVAESADGYPVAAE